MHRSVTLAAGAVLLTVAAGAGFFAAPQGEKAKRGPLPSWNDTPTKKAVLDFVARVTTTGAPDFVTPAERIATFDNDGTLWCEQPIYTEIAFALDRIKTLAPKHPEWKDKQPFKAVLEGDRATLLAGGEKALFEIVTATHTGMTVEDFEQSAKDWLATARHPRFDRPYTECIYQPMLEVMSYLREKGFKIYIVTGGTTNFVRAFGEKLYGVPPEQVIGTTFKTKFEARDGKSDLMILPQLDLIDDRAGKPVGIGRSIGRRPLMAFGNSDGDFEMLEYTTTGKGPRFGLIVHHTDAEREYAYDRKSPVGRLAKALDQVPKRGWTVVDMKKDWKVIFPGKE